MAINRAAHPITDDEIINCLERMAKEIMDDAKEQHRFGDTRPELLLAAAERIREVRR